MVSRRKFKAHFVVGDFNLPEVNWSDGVSPTLLEGHFIDLFNDISSQTT